MGVVIGPFDGDDWWTMLMLKKSISKLQESKKRDRSIALRNERKLFKKYVTRKVA